MLHDFATMFHAAQGADGVHGVLFAVIVCLLLVRGMILHSTQSIYKYVGLPRAVCDFEVKAGDDFVPTAHSLIHFHAVEEGQGGVVSPHPKAFVQQEVFELSEPHYKRCQLPFG